MAPKSPWKKNQKPDVLKSAAAEQASPAINYGEVQAEEVEVLQAIYMEDFEEVEVKGAWSKTTDRSFKLRLRSFSDQESMVVLSVRLTATYPKTLPLLDVAGTEAYHERTQKRIRSILANRPKQLLGEVMIHAIASEIQDALEDAVSARQQGTLPSLEEERASAEEVAITLAKAAEEAEARRVREAEAEEARVLKQMVDDAVTRTEKRKPAKVTVAEPNDDSISFDQPAILADGNESLQFSSVSLVSPLETKPEEQLHLATPQTQGTFAPLVAVKRLTVQKARDEIMQIESYLEAVRKVRHIGILGLLAYRIDRIDEQKSQVVLCSQYADRGTLHGTLLCHFLVSYCFLPFTSVKVALRSACSGPTDLL